MQSIELLAYETDILPMNDCGGQRVKDLDYLFKQCYGLIIFSSEFTEGPRLLLKDFNHGLNRDTTLELDREWVSDEVYPRLIFILENGPKERFENE